MRSRLALGLAVVLAACSSGGGSGSSSPLPVPPWGTFRQGNANSGANGSIDTNTGAVSHPIPLDGTLSTPTIDLDGNVLIGTKHGVQAYDPGCFVFPTPDPTPVGRCPVWTFNQCTPPCGSPPCPSPSPVPVGSVSASPSVTAGGTVVVGTDGSDGLPQRLYAFQEEGDSVTCLFAYPPLSDTGASFSTKSSAATLVNSDLTLSAAFVGGDDGRLRALNPDGTVRWSYPAPGSAGRITSSPAVDLNSQVRITAEDGTLAAISFAGREVWRVPIGTLPVGSDCSTSAADCYQASPAVATTTYAIGAGGAVYGINPNGTQKWTPPARLPLPASGSPAFLALSFDVGATLVFDTIVYVVDTQGTAYGLRDLNGSVVQLQRCTGNPTQECMQDSCTPPDECSTSDNLCKTSRVACTSDSCNATKKGPCITQDGTQCMTQKKTPCPLTSPPITTSPAVSGDPFVVVGTTDGQICARNLDGNIPGQDLDTSTSAWEDGNGCVALPDGGATRSSPIIGLNGVIYVTTDAGLYAIQ